MFHQRVLIKFSCYSKDLKFQMYDALPSDWILNIDYFSGKNKLVKQRKKYCLCVCLKCILHRITANKNVDIFQTILAKITKNRIMLKRRPDNDINRSIVSSPLDTSFQETFSSWYVQDFNLSLIFDS